jgi:hypothetical protein
VPGAVDSPLTLAWFRELAAGQGIDPPRSVLDNAKDGIT